MTTRRLVPAAVAALLVASPAAAQPHATPHAASTTVAVPGGCSVPRPTPPDAVGCYVAGTESLGTLGGNPVYWHLDAFPSRAAAEGARRGRGVVAEAHGRVWLFTIADSAWRPGGGERVARVGPLPVVAGRTYAAHYNEGVVPAAARTPVHRHAGPEAWYVLEGAQCLETPDGFHVVRAGESYVVREGPPMLLAGVEPGVRRSIALVLHDASQPWTILAPEWTPKGACPR